MFPMRVGICQSLNRLILEFAISFVRVTMAEPKRHGHSSRRSLGARASSRDSGGGFQTWASEAATRRAQPTWLMEQ